MYKIRLILAVFILVSFSKVFSEQALEKQTPSDELNKTYFDSSTKAASDWLSMMDDRDYAGTWEAASTTLKLTVPKHRWIKMMEKLRGPLGSSQKRKLQLQAPARDPKNLPKGHYMVLFYQTDFSGRPQANELLTMVLESDGKWRALTYHVR